MEQPGARGHNRDHPQVTEPAPAEERLGTDASRSDAHGHAPDERGRRIGEGVHSGIAGLLERVVGHSHDTADRFDPALEGSRRGIWAVKVSFVGLGVTAVLQVIVFLSSGSVALFADTIHNFADALSAVPLWIAFALGRRASNRRFTYGYGRAEDIAGVAILALILASAVLAAWEGAHRLVEPQPILNLGWVMAAGIIGFVGNEAVAVFRMRIGRAIGSAALVADGYHARMDGLTSLAVVLGAVGVLLGFPIADPLVGLGITVVILFVLRRAAADVLARVMDAIDPDTLAEIEGVLARTPGVQGVRSARVRWVGHQLWAEADVLVDAAQSLASAHAVAELARHRLLHAEPKLANVSIHVDPSEATGEDHHLTTAHHFA